MATSWPPALVSRYAPILDRPARKQVKEIKKYTPVTSGEFNIWYHRYCGYDHKETRRDRGELTRVCIAKDAGKTRGDIDSPICIHFAMGKCVKGADCTFKHQLPNDRDESRAGITHDVFGRERYKTDRDDMGGVGSFSRENRTLYLGGLKAEIAPRDMEDILRKHFEEFGQLEYIRVLPNRGIGFVRYRLRVASEFAKVAMAEQSLDNEEILNIRWAYADPNPVSKAVEEQAATTRFVQAAEQRVRTMDPQQKAQMESLRQLEALVARPEQYPDTSQQFVPPGSAPAGDAPAAAADPAGQAVAPPVVAYKYQFIGNTGERGAQEEENTERQQPNQETPATQHAEDAGAAAEAQAPAAKRARGGPGGSTGGAPTAKHAKFREQYAPNPYTGEHHPYAYGFYYPRQGRAAVRETPAERERRVAGIAQYYEGVYRDADHTGPGAPDPAAMAAPPPPPPGVPDEPGFHNDQPLT